ncbi:uncharacterized protein EMH_0008920 [Eimeria mitis]|uniref:Uncharacterized protein n=1 Tax=Eimeria mitis TaxID=44415 RepID=U6K101_9EIME|nr:uncharacterized protein EMH_0008920 [Eimeria mitis]CDJ31400.1 hypothetical protein, conserved [Eimeria mitis]
MPQPKVPPLGPPGASMQQGGPGGGGPWWPPEAVPAPAVRRMKEELQDMLERDIHRFGVLTHARAPNPTYPFPPRSRRPTEIKLSSAYKPAPADPWASLQRPGGMTPRLGQPSNTSSGQLVAEPEPRQPTLEELWFAATAEEVNPTQAQRRPPASPYADWGPLDSDTRSVAHAKGTENTAKVQRRDLLCADEDSSVEPLAPLPALTEDDFLRGPGGPPLSDRSRQHLLSFGLDYKEAISPRSRKQWSPMERERWSRSRLLRYLIKTKQVVFRQDLLDKEFKEDCEKYLKKKQHKPRKHTRSAAETSPQAPKYHPYTDACTEQGAPREALQRGPRVSSLGAPSDGGVPRGPWWGPSPVTENGSGVSGGPIACGPSLDYPCGGPPQAPSNLSSSRGPLEYLRQQLRQQKRSKARAEEIAQRDPLRAWRGAPQGTALGAQGAPEQRSEGEWGCAVMQRAAKLWRSSTRGEQGEWGGGEKHGGREGVTDTDSESESEREKEREREADEANEEEYYRRHLPWCYHFELEKDFNSDQVSEQQQKTQKPKGPPSLRQTQEIKLHKAWESELLRLYEAAEGELPSLFVGTGKPTRQKHPKDKTIPYALLKRYGAFIDSITSCGLLQQPVAMTIVARGPKTGAPAAAAAERRPASNSSNSSSSSSSSVFKLLVFVLLEQEVERYLLEAIGKKPEKNIPHMEPPKGPRVNPNYNIDKDKLAAAAKKLHIQPEEQPKTFEAIEKRSRLPLIEETKTLGGGRYVV